MKTFSLKKEEIKKNWVLIDAKDAVLGRLAAYSANVLRGKNKPNYTPNQDCGDNLIIINADHVYLTGKKEKDKTYFTHTGYPGGGKETSFADLRSSKPEKIIEAQNIITDIYVDEKVEDYILNLIFATRDPLKYNLKDLDGIIDVGASPRATINIVRAAKARAFTDGRGYVTPEDIRYIGADILRHRVVLTYEAEAEELSTDQVISRLFEKIEVP